MFSALKNHIRNFKSIHYVVVLFAITTQVQITLFATENYMGIRISLADLLIPLAGLYVLFSLLKKKTFWPKWLIPHMLLWLGALIAVMSVSLINGYFVNDGLLMWAFVNKYIGFLLLVSYLALGGWALTNADEAREVIVLFTVVFVGFFVITLTMSASLVFVQAVAPFPLWLSDYPWDGFMANRNAFVVVFIMVFILVIYDYLRSMPVIPTIILNLFWVCVPIFFVFNDSRTGWIVSAFLALLFLSKNTVFRLKAVMSFLCAGILIAYGSYFVTKSAHVLNSYQMQFLMMLVDEEKEYIGDSKRFIAVEDGLELYRNHNPLIGAGLGSYKPFQIEKRGEYIDVIDFTGLWLLVETGLIGLLAFSAFFLISMRSLYREGYQQAQASEYHRAMLVFLIVFAFMSVLHELMYTRILWFAMGLALAKPRFSA